MSVDTQQLSVRTPKKVQVCQKIWGLTPPVYGCRRCPYQNLCLERAGVMEA